MTAAEARAQAAAEGLTLQRADSAAGYKHVRLGDNATVRDGYADTKQETFFNGKRAVRLAVYRVGDQSPKSVTDCRQTSLFSSTISGSGSSEWLVDVNCLSGDAGGLPGYPMTGDIMADTGGNLAPHTGSGAGGAVLGDAGVPGDEQCANGRVGAYCTDCPAGQVVDGEGCADSGR